MTTRAHGPAAGLRWLKRGINLGRHNPRAIFGGVALVALVAMLPSLLQLLLQPVLGPGPVGMAVILTVVTLLSLLLMPPVIGGYLRVIDASERGRPTSAGEVLAPFRSAPDFRRLIGFGLVMTLLYLVLGGALVYFVCPQFPAWYMQIAMLSQAGPAVDATALPPPPDGLGAMLALGLLLGVFLGSVYAIGFGQIAIGGQRVRRALADGFGGTLRNLLPLLVLALVAVVLMLVVLAIAAVLALAVGYVAGLLHPALGGALATAIYLLMMLVLYVVMFGTMYHLWRDVAGDGGEPVDAGPRHPPGQVEL